MERAIRWGILGTGSIARQFAAAVLATPGAELAAVGSRNLEKAQKFAQEHKSHKSYGSYFDLAKDPDLDAIYIATPHPMHAENAVLCLEYGKSVLCEKPFTLNARQAKAVVHKARKKKLFLMEAMWTRFFPIMFRLRDLLADGALGRVQMVAADFGFSAEFNAKSRLFDPALGGGALMDVGIYTISLASMILGKPSSCAAGGHLGITKVDERSGYVLTYPAGEMASLYAAVTAGTPWEATIAGEKGRIRIHRPFWKPSAMTLTLDDFEERIEMPFEGNGYQFEVEEVNRCIREGKTENEIMPLDESIEIMETMDELRKQMGVNYPGD